MTNTNIVEAISCHDSQELSKKHQFFKVVLIVYILSLHVALLLLGYTYFTNRGVVNQPQAASIGYGLALKECVPQKEENCASLKLESAKFERPVFQDDSCAEWELSYATSNNVFSTTLWLDVAGNRMPHQPLPSGNGVC